MSSDLTDKTLTDKTPTDLNPPTGRNWLAGVAIGLGGLIALIGTWLPWLTHGDDTLTGLGKTTTGVAPDGGLGYGYLMAVTGAIVVVLGSVRAQNKAPRATAIVALVLAALAIFDAFWFYKLNVDDDVSAGYGLYISIAGMAVAAISAIWAFIKK